MNETNRIDTDGVRGDYASENWPYYDRKDMREDVLALCDALEKAEAKLARVEAFDPDSLAAGSWTTADFASGFDSGRDTTLEAILSVIRDES